jgi:hypothetical protein
MQIYLIHANLFHFIEMLYNHRILLFFSISRLFNSIHGSHKDPSLLKTAPPIYKNAFHNLMNTGPQGVIKVWTEMFLTDMQYVSLLVKHDNTAFEVIKMVLEKSNAKEDPESYRICEINERNKGWLYKTSICGECR